ncbi:MAG: carbonic anhydrase family protein [Saprospiraceae bacterium]|jgi:carbonic anhydrase|nr:carbonic anhydrase family protein [Saprospiraceae bacterium]
MTTRTFTSTYTIWQPLLLALLLIFAYSCKDDEPADDVCTKWEYEGVAGPDHWMSLCDDYADCSGIFQSPVNITGALFDPSLSALSLQYTNLETDIEFNGHTIEFDTEKGNNTLNLNGETYKLLQFHFHTHSEHAIEGIHTPLELHLVHQHPATGNRVVVGVLFEEGAENAFLSAFMDHLPSSSSPHYKSSEEYNPADVLPPNRSYYTYPGSLTTPPCTQNVIWYVLAQPVEASPAQIQLFEAVMHENSRPLRPLQERAIRFFEE